MRTLPQGRCNFPLYLTEAERAFWGQLAYSEDRSTGNFMKRMLEKGLAAEDPTKAQLLREIRAQRMTIRTEMEVEA